MSNALELRSVRKSFGRTEIIRGADLTIRRGERFALIGPNGAGKSTLFNLISGRMNPDAGEILLNGRSTAGLRAFEIHRRGLARSFQISALFHRMSVLDNLRCAVLWSSGHGYSFWRNLQRLREVSRRAEEVLLKIGLERHAVTPAGELTYAEQRALEIGITMAGGAEVVLLDEPTAGMSRWETEAAIQLIREFSADRTLVVVEHDMEVVFKLADRIGVVVYGEVIACGTPSEIQANPLVQEAYLGPAAAAEK